MKEFLWKQNITVTFAQYCINLRFIFIYCYPHHLFSEIQL